MRKNGMCDIEMIKGGLLAWKLCCKGRRVVCDVVGHNGSIGLGVYRREEANRCISKHDMTICIARGDLT